MSAPVYGPANMPAEPKEAELVLAEMLGVNGIPHALSVTPECDPDCPACADEADITETRRLAMDAVDWRALGNRCGVHPADMRAFLWREITLSAPTRKLIREALNG